MPKPQPGGMYLGMQGISDMMKEGTKHFQGIDEVTAKNLQAAKQLADITRTSLGPQGRNKIVINHIEKMFVTSDAATILKELEVAHPAANMLVMASKQQEEEIGDGSNLAVIFAGEILFGAADMLRMGMHVSDIVKGYERASKKALELLPTLSTYTLANPRSETELAKCIKGVIASKQYGYEDFLSGLIAKACSLVMPKTPSNFVVDNVRVCKVAGLSVLQSTVVHGMVFTRVPLGMVKHVENAKVAAFSCAVDAANTDTKGTVLIHNAEELKNYNRTEEDHMNQVIKAIADLGVKLIVSGSSVGEMAAHFIERHGLMCLKIQSKFELRRFCRTVGATPLTDLRTPSPEELGFVTSAREEEIGGTMCTVVKQADSDSCGVATLLVRAATNNMLDDVERAIDDGVNSVRALVKDGRMVAGAGAAEIELARQLSVFAASIPGLEQYAVKKFAEAFEVVPKTLAENAGMNATDIVTSLYAAHNAGQTAHGVDVENATVAETGVLDVLATKLSAIELATDAACTVLRVDQIIMSRPAGGPKAPAQGGARDDD